MEHTFETEKQAIEAGYRPVNRKTDHDVSGGSYYGYQYENPEGERTVTVSLTEELNKGGGKGCYLPMYAPKK